MATSFTREARLQEPTAKGVLCLTCERRCELAEGEEGWCRTRRNRDGTLYTLIYGAVSSLACNPVEKKPFYHFYPGSLCLTAGSWSCNFACPWCQNDGISKRPPSGGRFLSPERFVERTLEHGCRGTSISFNEPTLSLEWSLEVFRLAREAGLYNTFVSNGYMTEPALELLVEAGLDGINIDIKGDSEAVRRFCGVDVDLAWRNARQARGRDVWVEVTTLVIPGVSDGSECLGEIASRLVGDLGPDTPWHLSRYFPAYRFTAPPTPTSTLERARDIGREAGLRYVYLGNVGATAGGSTHCPSCGARLATRAQLTLLDCDVTAEGTCPRCGQGIEGVGWRDAR